MIMSLMNRVPFFFSLFCQHLKIAAPKKCDFIRNKHSSFTHSSTSTPYVYFTCCFYLSSHWFCGFNSMNSRKTDEWKEHKEKGTNQTFIDQMFKTTNIHLMNFRLFRSSEWSRTLSVITNIHKYTLTVPEYTRNTSRREEK